MANGLGPGADLAVKVGLSAVALGLVCLGLWGWGGPWDDYSTQRNIVQPQPVPFSHRHHVSGLGLDCRYCHTAVEVSSNAGLPPVQTCMTCHSQIWTNATMLEPVRQAYATGKTLRWNAVNYLPDYVFFDHSIHVAKGVGCTTCHGPIGDMPLTWKSASLYMSWCLDCHANPAPHLRPHEAVFDPNWRRTPDTPSGEALLRAYHIHPETLTDCSVCHR
ncbi:MAG TPA: cytochrome c3 family protein [Alphaproteobacteria bacterium]|nr:cytochrome c3 family protein [Alphaproteobacteria bacterium]